MKTIDRDETKALLIVPATADALALRLNNKKIPKS